MNETHCKKLNAKPTRAIWSIKLDTRCPSCGEEFDVIAAHHDFIGEQNGCRSGVTGVECHECGNEFQIEMEF